jgi:hypothetical protein
MIAPLRNQTGASWHDVLERHRDYDDAKAIKTPVHTITCHGPFIHKACGTRHCRDVAAPTYGETT